jgi:hypothetical protein
MTISKIKKLIVHCKACDETWEYQMLPGQTLYGAAYIIGARHEGLPCTFHKDCYLRGMANIELVGISLESDGEDASTR